MSELIDLKEKKLSFAVKKAYRNWRYMFQEEYDADTRPSDISDAAISFLAQGKDKGVFYLYDLIMNLLGFGSGFKFNELSPRKKIETIDRYLILIDTVRFECMKRLGWLERYPGDYLTFVELVLDFDRLIHKIRSEEFCLRPDHKDYHRYNELPLSEREIFVRNMIPDAIEKFQRHIKGDLS